MDTPRFHPLRAGAVALLVAVLIPTMARADNEAPQRHRSSSPKYQVITDHVDLTLLIDRSAMHTPSAMQAEAVKELQARQARQARKRRLAEGLGGRVVAPRAATGPTAVKPPTASPRSVDWDAIASCESGGRWNLNTGNGFWGGLQFTPGTWFAYGGGPFDGSGPFPYSRSAQIAVAQRVVADRGLSAWPYCGRYA